MITVTSFFENILRAKQTKDKQTNKQQAKNKAAYE